MSTEKSLLEKVATEVTRLTHMISGDPFDPEDVGIKGTLLKTVLELKDFNANDHKANTAFRKRKESEMSRIMVGVIILIMNVIVVSVIAVALKQ